MSEFECFECAAIADHTGVDRDTLNFNLGDIIKVRPAPPPPPPFARAVGRRSLCCSRGRAADITRAYVRASARARTGDGTSVANLCDWRARRQDGRFPAVQTRRAPRQRQAAREARQKRVSRARRCDVRT